MNQVSGGHFRSLPDDLDFLLIPVSEGLCKYESLRDGTLTLEDLLIMNVFLSNKYHNQAEALRIAENGTKRN